MLRLSKKMMFAIEAVLDIAYHAGAEPVQSREITRRQGIPRRYLEHALQHLVRQEILIGVRGPRGGDIVRVVREMEADNNLIEETQGSELGYQVVRPLWRELQDGLMERLDSLTVDELCTRANQSGIVSEGRRNLDFTI